MKTCEVCGEKTKQRWITKIGNSKLKTCKNCKDHGKSIKKENKSRKTKKTKKKTSEKTRKSKKTTGKTLIPDYGEKIKRKREKKELTQEELSNQINEKESTINKIEKQKIKPPKRTAKKLEKKLNLKLYEKPTTPKYKSKNKKKKKKKTIGDVIELKE